MPKWPKSIPSKGMDMILYLYIYYIVNYIHITYNINVYLQYISHPRGWEIHLYQCILRDLRLVRKHTIHQRPGPRNFPPADPQMLNFLDKNPRKSWRKQGSNHQRTIILSTNVCFFSFQGFVSELAFIFFRWLLYRGGYTYCFICFCFEVDFGRFYGKVVDSSTDSWWAHL